MKGSEWWGGGGGMFCIHKPESFSESICGYNLSIICSLG